jgi:mono/diheme cytochrome c family protein
MEEVTSMRNTVLFCALLLVAAAAGAQNKPVVEKRSANPTIPETGKQMYMHYCAACHGANGKGMGPAADSLKTPPPDLTTLATRHDGKFPYEYVNSVLRFGTRFVAHGSSDMPIWGPIFGSMDNYNELSVQQRIKKLCDYLASIQEKES